MSKTNEWVPGAKLMRSFISMACLFLAGFGLIWLQVAFAQNITPIVKYLGWFLVSLGGLILFLEVLEYLAPDTESGKAENAATDALDDDTWETDALDDDTWETEFRSSWFWFEVKEGIFALVILAPMFAAILLLAFQLLGYLQSGEWQGIYTIELASHFPELNAWVEHPNSWIGVHKILSGLPLTLGLFLFGMLWSWAVLGFMNFLD